MDGILVLAKPPGPTSHDMVALVRRLSGTKRVGHGGTLDPFAAGVLPIFLGKATRVVEFHLGAAKHYRATVCFGAQSDTDDLMGELTPSEGPAPTRDQVEAALAAFRGPIRQRPPVYSAIKVDGRRAYAIARGGETPELAERTVTIHELTLTEWDGTDPSRPIAILDVACSAGTYIRAIARDLGAALGSAAYLGALTRTASGTFTLADAVSIERIREAAAAGEDALKALLRPVDEGLEALPLIRITAVEQEAAVKGQFVRPVAGIPAGTPQEAMVRLVDETGRLVALGRVHGPRVAPEKVLVDIGAQPRSRPEPAAAETPGAGPGHDTTPAAHREGRPSASSADAGALPATAPETRLIAGLDALERADGPLFVVVGVFDGLHRGHDYLLGQLRSVAAMHGARPTVITFDAHPDEVLLGSAPPILCDPDERLVRLAAAGIEVTVVQHFDRALRMTPYQEFIAMITRRTTLTGLLMTPDAAFGHQRHGTADALSQLGRDEGFEVVVVPPFRIGGREVRSADIRELIGMGDLVGAAALLGRPYAFVGERSAVEAGSLADPAHDVLTFRLPVALPPPGTHRGYVEPAWAPGSPDAIDAARAAADGPRPSTAGEHAAAVEIIVPPEPGWVEVRSRAPLPDAARLRITLTR